MLDQIKHKLLDRFGLEVKRSGTFAHFLRSRPIDLVVDAGANVGQFGSMVRQRGYRGRIHSFEPVAAAYRRLEQVSAGDPNWQATQTALGAAPGTATINVFPNNTLSSMLEPTSLAEYYDVDGKVVTETVPITTLDEALSVDSARSVLLKVDVQGLEREVLEGARLTLNRTIALFLELPIAALYKGSWTFIEALQFVDGLGFEPAQFKMVNGLPEDPASAVEFDVLFRRKTEA
jgi:FkbM family methyltransferase